MLSCIVIKNKTKEFYSMFLSNVLKSVHSFNSKNQTKIAISFPDMTHINPGETITLFSDRQTLNNFQESQSFSNINLFVQNKLVDKSIIIEVHEDQHTSYCAYIRNRKYEKQFKLLKGNNSNVEDHVFIRLKSQSNQSGFSIFIDKKRGDKEPYNINLVNSYGLSKSDSPVYLPRINI